MKKPVSKKRDRLNDKKSRRAPPLPGIYIVAPHAYWVWTGYKSAIVKSRRFLKYIKIPVYLCDRNACYGVIELARPVKISLSQFKAREKYHHVSEKERKRWWPTKKTFWYYPLKMKTKFSRLKRYSWRTGTQTFMRKVQIW